MSASELKYLLTIKELCGSDGRVRMTEVAGRMGVTTVSVYRAIERLERARYVGRDGKRLRVTDAGDAALEEYKAVIGFISGHLTEHCGTSSSAAYEDALRVACAFGDESRRGIAKFLREVGETHGKAGERTESME